MRASTYSSKMFTISGEGRKVLTAFCSDLSLRPGEMFGTIFTDAIDQGLFILSEKTGKIAAFSLKQTLKDKDGDITHWMFEPVAASPSLHYAPRQLAPWADYKDLEVAIFNT